jgi:hypothetical protein
VEIEFERRETEGSDADDDDDEALEARADTGISAIREERERIERARRARAAIPRRLELDATIHFREGRVAIVTLDPETRRLMLLDDAPSAARSRNERP